MTTKKEDIVIMLHNVRATFPHYFEAVQVQGKGKVAFSGSFLMPPEHPDIAILQAGITQCANDKWGARAAEILPVLIAGDRVCLHDGNIKANHEGYAGNMFVSSRSFVRPLVIGTDKAPLTAEDGKPYSGCYVNAQISLWAQDNSHGKRVNAQLRGVQFLRDGEAFSGGGKVADVDEFNTVDDSADGDAPAAAPGAWGASPGAAEGLV